MAGYGQTYDQNQYMMAAMGEMNAANMMNGQMGGPRSESELMDGGVPEPVERANIRLQGDQPVVPVPVYQDIYRKDKFQSIPQVEVHDTVQPYLFHQQATHEIPRMEMTYQHMNPNINIDKRVDTNVDVQVPLGYLPHFQPKWDVREVPRPIPKYTGEQQTIEVPVPQIQYVDRHVEKPIVVDVQQKIVPRVEQVDREVEVLQYEWQQKHHDIPVYRMVPKVTVDLDCPAPLIVPMPQTRIVNVEPTVTRSNFNYVNPCGASCYPTEDARQRRQEQLHEMQSKIQEGYLSNQQLYGGSAVQQNASGLGYAHGQAPAMTQLATKLTQDIQDLKNNRRQKPSAWNLFGLLSTCDNLRTHNNESVEQGPADDEGLYPSDMPQDFATFFQQNHKEGGINNGQNEQISNRGPHGGQNGQDGGDGDDNELEPSVSYKGAITKPAEFGGQLDPISFKLHAIEVHQYVDIPNHKRPEFVDALPPGALQGDQQQSLQRLFGAPPPGWADPGVTGMPAPLIKDIMNNRADGCSNPSGKPFMTHNNEVVTKMIASPLPPGCDVTLPDGAMITTEHMAHHINGHHAHGMPIQDGSNLPGRPNDGHPDNTLDTA